MTASEFASWASAPWIIGPFALARPLWLLAWLPLAVLAWRSLRRPRDDWAAVCDPHLLAHLRPGQAPGRDGPRRVLAGLAALVVLALAGPARPGGADQLFRNAAGRVVVLDVSPSMALTDIPPSRLSVARAAAAEAAETAGGRQVALVVFAGDAYLLSPFTTDTAVTLAALDGVAPGLVPETGSRPAAGLLLARALLDGAGIEDGEILLVGDGGGIDSSALSVARAARQEAGRRTAAVLAGPAQGAADLAALAEAGGARCACRGEDDRPGLFERPLWQWSAPRLTASPERAGTLVPLLQPLLAAALLLTALLLGRRPA